MDWKRLGIWSVLMKEIFFWISCGGFIVERGRISCVLVVGMVWFWGKDVGFVIIVVEIGLILFLISLSKKLGILVILVK